MFPAFLVWYTFYRYLALFDSYSYYVAGLRFAAIAVQLGLSAGLHNEMLVCIPEADHRRISGDPTSNLAKGKPLKPLVVQVTLTTLT